MIFNSKMKMKNAKRNCTNLKSGKPDFFVELCFTLEKIWLRILCGLFTTKHTKSTRIVGYTQMRYCMRTVLLFLLFTILFACNQNATNGKTLIVDVRSEGIWRQGHASTGVNIPLPELEKHKSELLKYDTVIFVCETGESAQQATSYINVQKERTTVFKNGGSWTHY